MGNITATAPAKMALTGEFRETIRVRAGHDPAFRKALFTEALNAYLTGDEAKGRESLYRMLAIVRALQKKVGVRLTVRAA